MRWTALDIIALFLLIIGGINWGLVGLFNVDLVATVFGTNPEIARFIYALVGVAAIYFLAVFLAKQTPIKKE